MSRDRLSHIHYEMHMLMFPEVVTFDCKQYLQQLMISESLMGVYHEGGSCKWQDLDIRYQSLLKIMVCWVENNVFLANVINIYLTSFYIVQEPLPSPSTSPQAPLCLRYCRCYARFHKWLWPFLRFISKFAICLKGLCIAF